MGSEWWEEFFEGPWLYVQRRVHSAEVTAVHAGMIERCLGAAETKGDLLDVPCGEGRVALEMARRGWRVTGIDQSDELLADARQAAEREQLSIEWRGGDMRDIEDVARFDAACCWGGSFGYFDDEGDARFATAVARALRPGGAFIVDLHLAESVLPQFQSSGASRVEDIWIVQERVFDLRTSRLDVDWTFLSSGKPAVTRRTSMRLYTFRELATLLREAGFGTVDAYDQASGAPFAVGAGMRRVTVVARRDPDPAS